MAEAGSHGRLLADRGKRTKISVVIAVMVCALLAGGVVWFVRARSQSAYASCIIRLKQIEGAKATWALEQKKQNDDTPTWADLFGRGPLHNGEADLSRGRHIYARQSRGLRTLQSCWAGSQSRRVAASQ